MPNIANLIDIATRQKFILSLPCFAMLTHEQSAELAALMIEVNFLPGQVIVEEKALVDSVYILAEGSAEVTRQVIKNAGKLNFNISAKNQVPVAQLYPGDTIGLSTTGFFSKTGLRTATITALSPVKLLALDIKKLHDFLSEYPDLISTMREASEQILRARFIKQSLPFNHLSSERLIALSHQVEDLIIPAGTVLLREGEPGDRCYLIYSGEIEISTQHEDGSAHLLAVLKSPTIFGEATLITQSTRNATARALTDCHLFELKHEYLSEILETEKNVKNTFMTLMVYRSRPLQNPNVTEHQLIAADEQSHIILKNSDNGSYFKLSEEGGFIWKLMDGQHTMQEITMELAAKYHIFAPDVVAGLISKLGKKEFLMNLNVDQSSKRSKWISLIMNFKRLMESRYFINNADRLLTTFYQKVGFILFKPIIQLFLAMLILVGFCAFGFSTSNIILQFRHLPNSWILIFLVYPFTLLSVALHEVGHALATKSYGREVHYMGIGWNWIAPVAFTDTSDMWLNPDKAERIFVNLAGICMDLLVGSLAAVFIYIVSNAYIHAFLWLFALFTFINAFRMLNPLHQLDGYYVLVDLFDRPRLRQSAMHWLIKRSKPYKNYIPEISYWITCMLFMIMIVLLTFFIQSFVFKILGIEHHHPILHSIIPILAGLISCAGTLIDIHNQPEE